MVDGKLLHRVKLSTGEAETDNVALTKYQLPPTEGHYLILVCIRMQHYATGIRYKRKRSIDPSEITEEPSAKKHKGLE